MSGAMEIYDKLEDASDENGEVSFGDIIESLRGKGFGAFFIAPAMIVVLPTGAIPGIPAICGALLLVIAVQIILGRKHPWIPKKIKDIRFSQSKYKSAICKAKPYAEKIDKFIRPRFQIMTKGKMKRLGALVCIALSVAIMVIGFIPMAPALFGSAILWFGIGFASHDGLLVTIGYIQAVILFSVVPMWM